MGGDEIHPAIKKMAVLNPAVNVVQILLNIGKRKQVDPGIPQTWDRRIRRSIWIYVKIGRSVSVACSFPVL
jgi:hypothetical protein